MACRSSTIDRLRTGRVTGSRDRRRAQGRGRIHGRRRAGRVPGGVLQEGLGQHPPPGRAIHPAGARRREAVATHARRKCEPSTTIARTPLRGCDHRKGEEQKLRPLDSAEARRKRKATANRDLTVLKAALNLASPTGGPPAIRRGRSVKPFKDVDGARLRYLTDDEARRVVNAARPGVSPDRASALLTGARWGELRRVAVADVDLRSGTVRLLRPRAARLGIAT